MSKNVVLYKVKMDNTDLRITQTFWSGGHNPPGVWLRLEPCRAQLEVLGTQLLTERQIAELVHKGVMVARDDK